MSRRIGERMSIFSDTQAKSRHIGARKRYAKSAETHRRHPSRMPWDAPEEKRRGEGQKGRIDEHLAHVGERGVGFWADPREARGGRGGSLGGRGVAPPPERTPASAPRFARVGPEAHPPLPHVGKVFVDAPFLTLPTSFFLGRVRASSTDVSDASRHFLHSVFEPQCVSILLVCRKKSTFSHRFFLTRCFLAVFRGIRVLSPHTSSSGGLLVRRDLSNPSAPFPRVSTDRRKRIARQALRSGFRAAPRRSWALVKGKGRGGRARRAAQGGGRLCPMGEDSGRKMAVVRGGEVACAGTPWICAALRRCREEPPAPLRVPGVRCGATRGVKVKGELRFSFRLFVSRFSLCVEMSGGPSEVWSVCAILDLVDRGGALRSTGGTCESALGLCRGRGPSKS